MAQTLTAPATAAQPRRGNLRTVLMPLALDVAAPMACYYLLHGALGMSEVAALTLSGVIPAVRVIAGIVRDRTLNGLAGLTLAVNVAGIALSFVTGDARMMIAKDSALSGVISLFMMLTAFTARPVMTPGMRAFITRGNAVREAAWERLASSPPGSAAPSAASPASGARRCSPTAWPGWSARSRCRCPPWSGCPTCC